MNKTKVGEVFTYFQKAGVAGVKLSGILNVGDQISIEGSSTNFTQRLDSMQIDSKPLEQAISGQEVGMKVSSKVRPHDSVYVITE
jgi:putative protease